MPEFCVETGQVEVCVWISAWLGQSTQPLDFGHVRFDSPMGSVLLLGVTAATQMAIHGGQLKTDGGMHRIELERPLQSSGRFDTHIQPGPRHPETDVRLHRRGIALCRCREFLQRLADSSFLQECAAGGDLVAGTVRCEGDGALEEIQTFRTATQALAQKGAQCEVRLVRCGIQLHSPFQRGLRCRNITSSHLHSAHQLVEGRTRRIHLDRLDEGGLGILEFADP